MGVIWTTEHNSDQNRAWKIEIIDTDSGTLIGEFYVNQDGFRIKYNGKGRELHERIISTSISFTLQVRNSTQEAFITNLATADEGRYVVKAYLNTDLNFVGVLIVDGVKIDNAPYPYDFELEAVDGIKLLKGVEWQIGTAKQHESLLSVLEGCFEELPTFGQYGTGDDFLSVSTEWWSQEHVDEGQNSGDMFDKTFIPHKTFGEKKGNGYIYFSCYDVLESILTAFNCRCIYSGGQYFIEQIGMRDSATVSRITYNNAFTQLSTSTPNYDINVNQSDNYHMKGGTIEILPPLRGVRVSYTFDQAFNLLPPPTPFSDARTAGFEEVGYFDLSSGEPTLKLQLFVESFINYTTPYTGNLCDVVFIFRLKIGSYYLSGDQADFEWSTDSSSIFIFGFGGPLSIPVAIDGKKYSDSVGITTPEVNEAGTIEVDLYAEYWTYGGGTVTKSTSPPSGVQHTWYMNNEVLAPTDGDSENDTVTSEFHASQPNGTETKELTIIMGDGAALGRPGVLAVNTGTDTYKKTTAWDDGSASYKRLGLLLAESILSQRKTALRIYNAPIYFKTDLIQIENRISYDGYNLIFAQATITTNFDEISVSAIQISIDKTGITNEEEATVPEMDYPDIPGGDNTGDPGNDPDNPTNPGQEGLITSEVIYEGDVITQIPVVQADQDYFATNDRIIIKDRITGVEQEFVVASPVEQGDTIVEIDSATLEYTFSIYSPVMFSPSWLNNFRPKYQLFTGATGDFVTVSNFTLPDPAEQSTAEIQRRLEVYRHGGRVEYNITDGFTIDFANSRIEFGWALDNETVVVKYL